MSEKDIKKIGDEGETIARNKLKELGFKVRRADWIIFNGDFYFVEVKHKKKFTSPPFDGQGLDIYKINDYLEFFKIKKIRTIILVIDYNTKEMYWNFIDVLEEGEHYDTKKSGIRIYPLGNYKKIDEIKELLK